MSPAHFQRALGSSLSTCDSIRSPPPYQLTIYRENRDFCFTASRVKRIVFVDLGRSRTYWRQRYLVTFVDWEYMVFVIALGPCMGSSCHSREYRSNCSFPSLTRTSRSRYSQFIEENFDVRSGRYKEWKGDDWLCTQCVTKLLSDNIQAWFDRRIQTEADVTTAVSSRWRASHVGTASKVGEIWFQR